MKHHPSIIVIALLLCAAAAWTEEPALPVDEAAVTAEMDALIDSTGDLPDDVLKQVHKLVEKGVKAHDAGDYSRAIEFYRQAIELNPVDDMAYYELAFSLSSLGDQTGALDAATRALVLDPKQEIYYVVKANVLDNLGFPDEAIRTYRDLLVAQPDSYMGNLNLGITLHRAGEYEQAEAAYLAAIESSPDHPSGYFHIARLCQSRGFNYEEQAYLEKFVEVGQDDRRLQRVESRLEELKAYEISVDPDQPYVEIEMVAQMTRTLWQSTTHRERFPDARGYELTFEEDHEVVTTILELWREEKAGDPAAQQDYYDLLLRLDDAGYLEEYIWYYRQVTFGERAAAWMEANAGRVEAFLDWARAEGLLAEEAAEAEAAEEPAGESFRNSGLPTELIKVIDESEVRYTVHSAEERDANQLFENERRRFDDGLKLKGDDRVACRKAHDRAVKQMDVVGSKAFVPVFRCFLPGDEAYQVAARQISSLALAMDDVNFRPQGGVESVNEKSIDLWAGDAWLFYVLAKAAWRMEPWMREANDGSEESDEPCLAEELFALAVLSGAYFNSLQPDVDGEEGAAPDPMQRDPALDRLVEAVRADDLRGFALFEVIHKAYGVPLDSLSEEDAEAVTEYLLGHVFARISSGD